MDQKIRTDQLLLHYNTMHWPTRLIGVLSEDLGGGAYKFECRTGARFTVHADECLQAPNHPEAML